MQLIDLHDWEVVGIEINKKLTDEIYLKLENLELQKKITLILRGVTKFYASDMMVQNVILDVMLYTENEESSYFKFCREKLALNSNFFNENPDKKILYIEPSVGVEVASVIESFEIL